MLFIYYAIIILLTFIIIFYCSIIPIYFFNYLRLVSYSTIVLRVFNAIHIMHT